MVTRKTTKTTKASHKHPSTKKEYKMKEVEHEDHELYVSYVDVINKRKSLLTGLKTALLAQEECELVMNLRKQRYDYINDIKKELVLINTHYVKLQKLFPNVKNILSHTEKEINELHSQINILSTSQRIDKREIQELGDLADNLEESKELKPSVVSNKIESITTKEEAVEAKKSNSATQKMNKLDRIKNNLSIIESKLKEL